MEYKVDAPNTWALVTGLGNHGTVLKATPLLEFETGHLETRGESLLPLSYPLVDF